MHTCDHVCVCLCVTVLYVLSRPCVSPHSATVLRVSILGRVCGVMVVLGPLPADMMNMFSVRRVGQRHRFLPEQQVMNVNLIGCITSQASDTAGEMSRSDQ